MRNIGARVAEVNTTPSTALALPSVITTTGLRLSESISIEEWLDLGGRIGQIGGAMREFTVRYPAPYADPGALPKLWAQHPGPLVGVRTGTGSVDVLDLDTRAAAREWGNVSRTFIRSDELVDVANQTVTERELPDA
jgi:hypothetical protein